MKSIEYQIIFKKGRRFKGPLLDVLFLSGRVPRLGLVVSAKVANAVGRNRIKRVLREVFRLSQSTLPKGDFVVIAKPIAATESNRALRHSFEKMIEKIR